MPSNRGHEKFKEKITKYKTTSTTTVDEEEVRDSRTGEEA